MKIYATLMAGTALAAVDLHVDFPGFLRARVDTNLQTFISALGGASAEPMTSTSDPKRPFAVSDEIFMDLKTAATRTCNNQHNACAEIANGDKANNPTGIAVKDCDAQQTQCQDAASANTASTSANTSGSGSLSAAAMEPTLHSSDENFFYFCDP